MGFGLLFLGYLFRICAVFGVTNDWTDPIGYLLLLYAACRLARYYRQDRQAAVTAAVGLLLSIAVLALSLSGTGGDAYTYLCLMKVVADCVFCFFMLAGIDAAATETGILPLKIRAFRNRIFSALYFALAFFLAFPWSGGMARAAHYLLLPTMLVGLVVTVLNAILIYSCYMWICLPEDLTMERKPSRFAWVNALRARSDARADALVRKKEEERRAAQEQRQRRSSAKKTKKKK